MTDGFLLSARRKKKPISSLNALSWTVANKQQNLDYINMSVSNLIENTVDFLWEF